MRTAVEWRSASTENYKDFKNKHPKIKISIDEWKRVIYTFNESFRDYILETGDRIRYPSGFGEFSISKKKRKRIKTNKEGQQFINLPIDWIKTRKKGKVIYNFNDHTEGYSFRWFWFKSKTGLRRSDLWYFKPSRATSRLLAHYIKVNNNYQHIYKEWKN